MATREMRVAVAGASGRMGRMVIDATLRAPGARLVAALERKGDAHVGRDAGELAGAPCGVRVGEDIAAALRECDVLIDFTRPEGTLAHLAACAGAGVRLVIGTTGFTDTERGRIAAAASRIAVAMAPNFSVGVNVLLRLVETAARTLGAGYDVEIVEAHHRHKVDAPSGTALRMGEVAARALGRDLRACAIYGREGVTGERDDATIGFATVRGGDLVGEHTMLFIGAGERLELTHRASSRANFATGALRAARFILERESGLYDMADVLGLKD
ncbi:MAG: 4-hydroxy-tetrahydrodipicolinate reductase [Burkholderiales bacterium]|nr:4-hydroxy-tetrahydrodipicolinate reductase [Burkholderiales bacterium]